MGWIQALTIIGVNATLFGALSSVLIWIVNKLDSDVKGSLAKMEKMDAKFESHSARIDQLYKMFVDLLKEKK